MPSAAVHPSGASAEAFAGKRLHVVTGKGGTGKTTVAAALAMALAQDGARVLLAEVEGRQGISQAFDVAPLGTSETRLLTSRSGGEVVGLSVDAKAALLEYLQLFYRLGRAGGALERVGAIDFATTIAPGVRDVLLIGKVYEAHGRPAQGRGRGHPDLRGFDAVVLDAPPTGRIGRFLSVNSEVADLARGGPIKSQADSIMRMLTRPSTAIHLVTLLEDMPVQETLDAIDELTALGLPLGAVVVNQHREPLVDADLMVRLADGDVDPGHLRALLTTAGLRASGPMLSSLIDQGRRYAERASVQADQLDILAETGRPLVVLPEIGDGIDVNAIRTLADIVAEQLAPGAERDESLA